jgi:hypothetical protein
LGYSPEETFDIPVDFDPCADALASDELIEVESVGLDELAN